jgi:hypothetical protein
MLFRLSLEEAAGFTRDAFGRQSMSEKRHATLDAKHTDTYQRNKKLRLACIALKVCLCAYVCVLAHMWLCGCLHNCVYSIFVYV